MSAAMMTSTFLDLGLSPAPTGMPGAPPTVAAGGIVPDFAKAMADLLTGAAPDALAAGVTANRQDVAVGGKPLPPENVPGAVSMPTFMPNGGGCILLDPDMLPEQGADAPAGTDSDPSAPADPGEPALEPALAWLMPPVPAAPVVPPKTPVAPIVSAPIPAAAAPANPGTAQPIAPERVNADPTLPTPQPVGRDLPTRVEKSLTPATPIKTSVALNPTPIPPLGAETPVQAAPMAGDCTLPAEVPAPADPLPLDAKPTVAGSAPTTPAPAAPKDRTARVAPTIVPLPTMPIATAPGAAPAIAGTPLPAAQPAPARPAEAASQDAAAVATVEAQLAASPWLQRRVIAPGKPAPAPITTTPREPLAAIPEAQLRAAATQRIEIRPVTAPTPDVGSTLAAAAAIRATPALTPTLIDTPTGSVSSSPLDAGILAPIAAGAPAAAPVTAPQQAGIDLTRDPGLHHMIDRIEQLRDAFDARDTRIRLIPDALGPVDISVRRDAASDSVQVHFTAAEAGTRQLIADAQHRLVELADSRGVRIERATVDSGSTNSSGQQAWSGNEQSRPQQQQAQTAPQHRAPTRAARDAEPESTDKRIA